MNTLAAATVYRPVSATQLTAELAQHGMRVVVIGEGVRLIQPADLLQTHSFRPRGRLRVSFARCWRSLGAVSLSLTPKLSHGSSASGWKASEA